MFISGWNSYVFANQPTNRPANRKKKKKREEKQNFKCLFSSSQNFPINILILHFRQFYIFNQYFSFISEAIFVFLINILILKYLYFIISGHQRCYLSNYNCKKYRMCQNLKFKEKNDKTKSTNITVYKLVLLKLYQMLNRLIDQTFSSVVTQHLNIWLNHAEALIPERTSKLSNDDPV